MSSARDQKSRAEFFCFPRSGRRLRRENLPGQETFVAALGGSRSATVTNWPGLLRNIRAARAVDRIRDRRRTAPLDAAAAGLAAAVAFLIVPGPGGRDANAAFAAMLEKVREAKSVRCRITVPGVEQTAGTEKAPFFVTIETADAARLEQGPLVSVFRRDGILMLDTAGKSATTFSNDAAKDRKRKRPDCLGRFRQADGSWGEPIEGKQVEGVATPGYRVTKKWIGENDPEWVKQRLAPWFGLARALEDLVKHNIRVHYLGKGLKAAAATQIVAWWKAAKTGRVIAIYGDFAVKEIDESAAPPPASGAGR